MPFLAQPLPDVPCYSLYHEQCAGAQSHRISQAFDRLPVHGVIYFQQLLRSIRHAVPDVL